MLSTEGTSTFSMPLETLSVTSESLSTSVSAAGSVSITEPFGISSSNAWSVFTFRPRSVSALVAASTVCEASGGIFTLPEATGVPGELRNM